MNLSTSELMVIERLLENRIRAYRDPEIEEILHKIRVEINQRNYQFNRSAEWGR